MLWLLFFLTLAHYGHSGPALLPDLTLTPGVVNHQVTRDDICKPGYAKSVRNVSESLKKKVYAEYGVKPGEGICVVDGCEVDHLVSLELGGTNDIKNLWPQPYGQHPGAHEKDRLENFLHEQVCKDNMPLAAAQSRIATDWYKEYLLEHLDVAH